MKLISRNERKQEMNHLGWIFALPLALALATHGLIHLMYVYWTGSGVDLGFNGSSWLPSGAAEAIIYGLVSIIIAGNCLGALGLLRIPVLRDNIVRLVIIGNVASLAVFAVMLPGLAPNVEAHVYGIITSIVVLFGTMYHAKMANALGKVLPNVLARRLGVQA